MPAGTDPPTIAASSTESGLPEELRERVLSADHLLVFTDFDGTLANITEEPDAAVVRTDAREALQDLQACGDTAVAIVSGRALDDVRDRVDLAEPHVAGNHGLEIDVDGEAFVHPDAEGTADVLDGVLSMIRGDLPGTSGIRIEDKGLTATVHHRMVEDETEVDRIEEVVRSAVSDTDQLRVTDGRRILEIRPDVAWDKGRAVDWITDAVSGDEHRPFRIDVGDDVSDEAAFRALEPEETAIRVADSPVETRADYRVRGPDAVASILSQISELRRD